MSLHREYIDTDRPNLKIRISLSFNKETIHWATSNPKEKGYQVVCTPVEVEQKEGYKVESFSAFSGFYEILYPIERQSKKRLEHAIGLIKENKERYINFFRDKGIKFKEDESNTNNDS